MAERVSLRIVGEGEREAWAEAYRALERTRRYPLGDDGFRIDHGAHPFRFFAGLGDPVTAVASRGRELLGWATVVRRHGEGSGPVWYACDLKVAPGAGVTLAFSLMRALMGAVPRGAPGYAVLMDAAGGRSRLARLALKQSRLLGLELGPALRILAVGGAAWRQLVPILEEYRGPVHLRSLSGVKDIILESTGEPMDLRHGQWGPFRTGEGSVEPRADAVHMFPSVCGDALDERLVGLGVPEMGRATVLHRGLGDAGPGGGGWGSILSSDI